VSTAATTSIHLSLGQVAASLALVAVAAAISLWRGAALERDIGIAVVRSFIQLTAIGYVINWTGVWMLFNPVGKVLPGLAAKVIPVSEFENLHAKSREWTWSEPLVFPRFCGTIWSTGLTLWLRLTVHP